MENKKVQGYVYAVIMGLLTAIICLAIADGWIGVVGAIKDYEDLGNGYHTFTLSTNDPTGRYIFWIGLLDLPVLFASKVKVKYRGKPADIFIGMVYLFRNFRS